MGNQKNIVNSEIEEKVHYFLSPAYNKTRTILACVFYLSTFVATIYLFIKAYNANIGAMATIGVLIFTILAVLFSFSFFMVELTKEVSLTINDNFLFVKNPTGFYDLKIELNNIGSLHTEIKTKKSFKVLRLSFYLKDGNSEGSFFLTVYEQQVQEIMNILEKYPFEIKYP